MADFVARSALAGAYPLGQMEHQAGGCGLTIAELPTAGVASLAARSGAMAGLLQAAREIGLELPVRSRFRDGSAGRAVWFGPERWLIFGASDNEPFLRGHLDVWATVTDQSDARILLQIAGPRAPDTLAKALQIDLHPRVFQPGHVALTQAAHIAVALWQTDGAPTYILAVQRSYAKTMAEFLAAAAAEHEAAYR